MSFDELRVAFHVRLGRLTQQKATEFAYWFVRASTLLRNLPRLSSCLYPCHFTSGLQPQLACLR